MPDGPITVSRWRVTGRHPEWAQPAIIDVTATSERYAVSQARGWLLRIMGDLSALYATYRAVKIGTITRKDTTV